MSVRLSNWFSRHLRKVGCMEPQPPVLGFAEIAAVLGVSKTRASALIARVDFPAPIATLSVGRIWAYSDVADYCDRHGRSMHPLVAS
jgi:predicted DNA-binding transcriptional regulator AlpA